MTDPRPRKPPSKVNPTLIVLLGGVAILILVIAFFATNRSPNQDRLTDNELVRAAPEADPAKRCAAAATYDLIKRDLFRRAAELRGSDQAAYDRLAAAAVVRMENPVLESEDGATGALNCSGSLSLDLPPGVAVVGGRRTLTADVDYTIQRAADGSGDVVLLKNADAIVAPLATLARIAPAPQLSAPVESNAVAAEQPQANVAASESANVRPGPPSASPGRPSFDCSRATSRGEVAVCSDSGLSALDLNMSTQYRRALGAATQRQRQLLQSTRNRFLAFRDRCPDRRCIADAYLGRMREIRDITEGRWQPAR
jgi:uncharacterized protein YecT (DUF1311 family)